MVKPLSKSILFVLLLTVMAGQTVRAEVKLYRYDGKLPFIRMMLGMMDAMGVIDRVPANGAYGRYGSQSSPWSSYSTPYKRALAMRGIYPGSSSSYLNSPYMNNMYGNNPFTRSPWLQSPWSQSGEYGSLYDSPLWGTPNWGVLPTQSYSPYDQSYWSSSDLDGWVNEPWETSEWNPETEPSDQSLQLQVPSQAQAPQQAQVSPPTMPLVQNFNFGVAEDKQAGRSYASGNSRGQNNRPRAKMYSKSPLLKLAPLPGQPPGQSMGQSIGQSGRPPADVQRRQSPLHKKTMQQPRDQQSRQPPPRKQQPRKQIREKPCVTEFCGLKKPNLNGLWVAENGEMLGVNRQKFLWSDGSSRYLKGQIKIQNEYLLARVEGKEQLMRFKYKLAGDHLLTMQPDGVIREFIRMTPEQYYGQYDNQYLGGY